MNKYILSSTLKRRFQHPDLQNPDISDRSWKIQWTACWVGRNCCGVNEDNRIGTKGNHKTMASLRRKSCCHINNLTFNQNSTSIISKSTSIISFVAGSMAVDGSDLGSRNICRMFIHYSFSGKVGSKIFF